jgi:hypothetical protein
VTYDFRAEGLAMALLEACHRGVKVKVVFEGNPRTGPVTNRVRKFLENDGTLWKNMRGIKH